MSFPGISRPARGAGLALLAVAVIAAVIGGITLTVGDGEDKMAEPPPSSSPGQSAPSAGDATSSPGASNGSSAPSAPETSGTPETSESAAPSSGASSKTTSPAPPSGAEEPGDGGNKGAGDSGEQRRDTDVAVRVYNNSTVEDLAARAAQDLRHQGWSVAKVSNYSEGVIPSTTAYYRKGTPEKAAALSLASSFGMRAKPRFDGIEDARQGVIVIVTKDYEGPVGKAG